MAKLAALVILLIAMAAATSTSARTESSCEMEMKEMMPMNQCMMWMMGKMPRNPRYRDPQQLEKCCSELMEFSSPCQCEAVKEMMMDMQRYGRMEEMEMERMEKMACSLPRMCGMSQECHSCSRRVFA